jgi:hypothetical protein
VPVNNRFSIVVRGDHEMREPGPKPPVLRPEAETPNPEAWFTTGETARTLGLTPKTLSNMRTIGKGPCFHKIGGRVWYRGKDIISYQQRRRYIASGVRDEG